MIPTYGDGAEEETRRAQQRWSRSSWWEAFQGSMEHPGQVIIIIVMSLLTLILLFMMKQWQWRLINSDGGDRQAGNLYGKPQSPRRLLCAVDKAKVNPRVVGTRRSNAEAETRLVLHNREPVIDNWTIENPGRFHYQLVWEDGRKGQMGPE